MHPLLMQWWTGLKRLAAGPHSLERLLVLTMGGTVLIAIAALALGAGGLLREQADQQALSRVRLAGLAARDEIRRRSEDALTATRLLASRPTLLRLLGGVDVPQVQSFLGRFCDTARLDSCAVIRDGRVLASTGLPVSWSDAQAAARKQGAAFMLADAAAPSGQLGATVEVPGVSGASVMVLRSFDKRFAQALSEQVGVEVRLLRLSNWLEAVDVEFRELHSEALATGQTSAAEIGARDLYASSTPVFSTTGEGVVLIEARLPASDVSGAVERFVRRLTVTTIVLGALALGLALLLARRIGAPLQALEASAGRLGRGNFSASIPVAGTKEIAALARTMDDMRRNLIDLTTTMRRQEAEARAVLQGVVEGVFAVDSERRIRYLNPQAERMIGAPAAELTGRFCGDVLRPCLVDGRPPCETACPIVAARSDGKAQATERIEAGGVPRTVVITSAAPTDGLQVQVMRDETELEAVRRARDFVLANISHEFRTPLAAQLASVELMLDGLDGMPRERVSELLGSLQRGTLRLTRLIDNLLESVRIESGQLSIRRQPVMLAQVVEDAEALIEGLLNQRRQRLLVDLPPDLPVVNGDAQRLSQAVTNLLANASKFAPEDSDIRIGARADGGDVSLWVEDEGPGAANLDGTSIFKRFYRSADQEPEPRGLGLGLWIVKSIVERHGGRVAAERTAEARTRFTITLPTGRMAA